jgi:prepilin-type N-terminal cleavage/methylation domain-containing protein
MKRNKQSRRTRCGGFTLTEVLVASSVSLTVLVATLGVYINVFKSWRGIELRSQADRDVNIAMSRLVYGVGERRGLRCANDVTMTTNSSGWTITYPAGVSSPQTNSIVYSSTAKTLVLNPGSQVLGRNILYAKVIPQTRSLVVTLRVDRVDGMLQARREIGTEIFWRN